MHIKLIGLRIATAASVLAATTLFAQMNHGNHAGHQHGGSAAAQEALNLPEPDQTVFGKYLKIESSLAKDSLEGVSDNTMALLDAVRNDAGKMFSSDVALAAEDLSKAKDLPGARQVFKRLSATLIKHLEANKDHAGSFERVFCSMANAKWLQKAGSPVSNPYLGASMARCGQIES